MGEELLHLRHSFQVEGQKRWEYWSAVRVTADGEEIVDSTQPLEEPPRAPYHHLILTEAAELPPVALFEHEIRLTAQRKQLVEKLEALGWEPLQRDGEGRVVRMRRAES